MVGIMNEAVKNELAGQTPWPDNAQIFQPLETEQILLPDNANCLYVQTFLKMCELKYEVVFRSNAEHMSPSGKVPFIRCGVFLLYEMDAIINFVASKGVSLTKNLEASEKAEMRAFISLVNTVLGNAEQYITWYDSDVYNQVTRKRYGSVYPWPLCHVLTYLKRNRAIKRLKALHWYEKSMDEVYSDVETCCRSLSSKLGDQSFFFGEQPTELDALVFAHVYTVLTTPLPTNKFAGIIRGFSNIVDHCQRIEKVFFSYYGNDRKGSMPVE